MTPTLMRNNNDCGVAVVSTVTELSYETVVQHWGTDPNSNLADSYLHHQQVLSELGFGWKTYTFNDLIMQICPPGKTAILISAMDDDPNTLLPENQAYLHWVSLARYVSGGLVLNYGDGERVITYSWLGKRWGSPFCVVYSVFPENRKTLPWYKRLYVWCTRTLVEWL